MQNFPHKHVWDYGCISIYRRHIYIYVYYTKLYCMCVYIFIQYITDRERERGIVQQKHETGLL